MDRAAEAFPAHLMPRLLGVEHLMKSLNSARRRVGDSHKLQMFKLKETLGYDASKEGDVGEVEDDVSGINVQGDTHINITTPQEKTTPLPTVTDKAKSVIPSLAMAVALIGGGSGIGYIVNDLLKPQPAVTQPAANDTDTDTITEFDFPKE